MLSGPSVIRGHREAYGASSIASGKEVASRADNLLNFDQMVSIMHRAYAADIRRFTPTRSDACRRPWGCESRTRQAAEARLCARPTGSTPGCTTMRC